MLLLLIMMTILCVSESDPAAQCKKTEHTSWRALWDDDTPISELKLLSDRVTSTETEGLTWRRSKKWEIISSTHCSKWEQLISVKINQNSKLACLNTTIVLISAKWVTNLPTVIGCRTSSTGVARNDNIDDFPPTYLFLNPLHLSFCCSTSVHQLWSSDHRIMIIDCDDIGDDDYFHNGADDDALCCYLLWNLLCSNMS